VTIDCKMYNTKKQDKKKLLCPKCRSTMSPMPLYNVEVDFCDHCHGTWFDKEELEKSFNFSQTNLDSFISGYKRTPYQCPRCYTTLEEKTFNDSSELIIEKCPACSGFFLDRGEYPKIQQLLKRRNQELRLIKKTTPTSKKTVNSLDMVHMEAKGSGVAWFQFFTDLPLELTSRQKLFSPGVTILIMINLIVFLTSLFYGFEAWLNHFGFVPMDITKGQNFYTFITAQFTHGDIFHIIGNMYFLFVLGDDVEDKFGIFWFLLLYLLFGVAGDIGHLLSEPSSTIPAIGASGAISGVLGVYVILFPKRKFLFRFFYFLWWHKCFEWPAYVYFGLWIGMQFLFAAMEVPGVGWWAHIGGFLAGVTVAIMYRLFSGHR